jgi:predicted transposase/invertase (TIGR01784 family)
MIPDIPLLKDSIVDVRCTDKKGRQFIVEMQMQWSDSFTSRVLFNASKAYVHQLNASETYELLQPVYSLNLVNDIFLRNSPEYYHHYKIVNVANTEQQIKGLEFVFVELPKFKTSEPKDKRLQALWLRFLTEDSNDEGVSGELLNNPDICEAVNYLEESSYSKEELEVYDRVVDAIRTHQMFMFDAKKEGLEEGRAEGLAEGKAEGKAEVVLNSHKLGLSIETIASITGLTESEIQIILKNS